MSGLTRQAVQDMSNIVQLTRALNSLSIDYSGARTYDELKQLLITHVEQQSSAITLTSLDCALDRDYERQQRLLSLYRKAEEVINFCRRERPVLDELNGYTPGFIDKITTYLNDLDQRCPIFVAGETSAGKTKFVNLLLGEQILPVSVLHATSVLCHIVHGDQKKLTVKYPSGESEIFDLDIDARTRTQILRNKIANTASSAHEIEISWPLPILKGRVSVVDSPGIGSLETMDQIVYDFIARVSAFLYIVNTSNAGGFQGDRLVQLVKHEPMPGEETSHLSRLDPNLAMFILHKWDQVPKEEESSTENAIFENMSLHWPGLQQEQLYRLSSLEAAECLNITGRHSPQFIKIWEGLVNMIPIALEMNTKSHYIWLLRVVECLCKIIDIKIEKATITKNEKDLQIEKLNNRIPLLRNQSDAVIQALKNEIEGKKNNIVKMLQNHMKSRAVHKVVTTWLDTETPADSTKKDEVKAKVENAINMKMVQAFKTWTDNTPVFTDTLTEIKQEFADKMALLDSEFRSFDKDLYNCTPRSSDLFNLPAMPIANWEKVLDGENKLWYYQKKLYDEYIKDKKSAMAKLSEDILIKITENDNIFKSIVDLQFERLMKSVDVLRDIVHKQLDADNKVFNSAFNDTRDAKAIVDKHMELKSQANPLKQELLDFKQEFF